MADINVKLLQGTEAKMAGTSAPAIQNGQLYFATIDEGTKGYIYLDSNGKRFSFGKYAETAGYATEAGAAENAKRAVSADTAGRLQIPILTSNILTTAVSQPAGTSALYFVGSNAITAVGSPANNSFIKIYKNENNNVLIDCYEALNGNHWINSNPNATSATSGWTGWIDLSVKEAAKHWETPVIFQITDGVNDGMGIAVDGSQSPIKLPLPNIIKATLNGNADSATKAEKLTTPVALKVGDTSKNFDGSAGLTWTPSEIGYRHEWDAIVKGQTWSRLCHVALKDNAVGTSYLLNIAATRNSVVYNDTFLIKTNHQGAAETRGKIIKISGSEYTAGYSIRLLTNGSGVSYVELNDNAASITSSTTQVVHCRLIPIYTGVVTKYTTFTSGATLPTDFAVTQTMTLTTADIQANVEGSFKGNLDGNATSATQATSAGKANEFSQDTTVKLTGDVTGEATSRRGWEIATTVKDDSHNHQQLTGWTDGSAANRNNPTTPNEYNLKFWPRGIKTKTAIGETDGSTYTSIIGFRGWSDSSCGDAYELGFTQNGNIFVRHGATDTWGNWDRIPTTGTNNIFSGLNTFNGGIKANEIEVGGNLTVINKTELKGALEVTGASTFTGLITANGGINGNVTGNLTGNADTATEADKAKKWSATKAFKVADNSGENAGTAVNVDGTANVTLRMPLTFKGNHTIDGNLSISGDTSTSGNVTLNGSGKTFTSNISSKFVKQIKGNISAAHGSVTGSANGYHLISIVPTSNWMLAFTIRVYQAYTYTDIAVSGYNYSSTQTWYSPKATIIGTNGTQTMDVVFGCSAANKLWVAIPASNYYGIDILNVTNGCTQIPDHSNLFTLSLVSELPTSTPVAATTVKAYAPWYRGEIVSTENGGTGNNAFTANRLLYSESATKLSSSGHYSSTNKVAINSTEIDEALTFYVNGNSKISGELNVTGNVDFDNNLNIDRLITQGGPTANTSIDAMNKFKTDLFIEGSGVTPNAPTVPGFYLGKSASDENRHMDIVSGGDYSYIDFNKSNHAVDYDFRILSNVSNGLVDFQWGSNTNLTDKRLRINGLTEVNSTHTTKNALKVTGGAQISNTLRIGSTSTTLDSSWCEGIRIGAADSTWVTIALGATGETGTNTHCWSIHRTNANKFSISKNSSSGLNGLVLTSIAGEDKAADGKMGLGTDDPVHRLHVVGDARVDGTLYLQRQVGTHAGRINFYHDTTHKSTWVEYMSNIVTKGCPTGGTPSTYGDVTAWARRSLIENSQNYGWIWEACSASHTGTPTPIMSLSSNTGKLKVKGAIETENNLIVAGSTTLNNTLTVTTGGAQITGNSKITGALEVTGRGTFAGLTSTSDNMFIAHGNEFNFIPDSYSNSIYINCQTVSRNSSGAVSSYVFLTGNGSTTSYADVQAKNAIFSGNLTVKGNTILGDANTDNTTIYGPLYKKGDSTNKGHIYLDGAASSSTSNTTQIIFREGTTEHIALSSNDDCFIINPSSTSSSPQIALYLGANATSSIPGGLSLGKQLSVGTNATIGGALQVNGTSTFTGQITANGGITGNVTGNVTGNAGGSAQTLASNSTANLSGCLQYFQSSTQTSGNDMPSAAWHHVIKMNHETGDSYYKRLLAFDFFSNTIKTTYKNGESTDHTTRWVSLWKEGDSVTGAVWNDYAECRESDTEDFGYVLTEVGDDSLTKTTERLQHFAGVSSDTWGFSQGETEKAKTPIAVAGRVLVYPYQDRSNYKPGDCVCAAAGGTVDIMTREEIMYYPDRIVGTVSCVPEYEEWGGGEIADRPPVKVNGRIWIKVR